MNMNELLAFAVSHQASDLHLCVGLPLMIRVDGELRKINLPAFSQETVTTLLYQIMDKQQRTAYLEKWDLDFSFEIPQLSRFRANIFTQLKGPAAVFRIIPTEIPSLEQLGLPLTLKNIIQARNGLILVTGPTGCGKSATIAALLNEINNTRPLHIVTLEDPIEYIHHNQQCLINQREIYKHSKSFSTALHACLRQDPDIILVGEMRCPETIRLTLTAAETGHLVFATLHTSSAAKTIHRIIDIFPAGEKEMVRSMLSESLQAVISQILVKRIGSGRIAACEIMRCTPAVRNLIRENKITQIYSAIQTGQHLGMQTLDMHLGTLVAQKIILAKEAQKYMESGIPAETGYSR